MFVVLLFYNRLVLYKFTDIALPSDVLWLCLIRPLEDEIIMFIGELFDTPLNDNREGFLFNLFGLFEFDFIGTAYVTKLLEIINPPFIWAEEPSTLFLTRWVIPRALNFFNYKI